MFSNFGLEHELRTSSWSGAVYTPSGPDYLIGEGNRLRWLRQEGSYQVATSIRPGGGVAVRLPGDGSHFGQWYGGGELIDENIKDDVTFSAWFRLDQLTNNQWLVIYGGQPGDGNAAENILFSTQIRANGEVRVVWEYGNGSNSNFFTNGAGIVADTPYNVVVVRKEEGAQQRVTVVVTNLNTGDVYSQTSGLLTKATGGQSARWRVGAEGANKSAGFDGIIGDIEFYTKAMPLERAFLPEGR